MWKNFADSFNRFGTIPDRDGRTDIQTDKLWQLCIIINQSTRLSQQLYLERYLQVYVSTSDAELITSCLADSVEWSCVSRSSGDAQRRAIPRARATRDLQASTTAPVSDLLLTSLLSGGVKVSPAVRRLTQTGLVFVDGTHVDHVDAIICATGTPSDMQSARSWSQH